ncbi:MAG: class I SAM-dependent methyltransferase [Chloroflexota bacterium]
MVHTSRSQSNHHLAKHMDEVAEYNQKRWSALVQAGVSFGKPFVDFNRDKALDFLDEWAEVRRLGFTDFTSHDVLCLASGGGQQSVCFSLLGANVTVLDLTPEQLDGDRAMAQKYGFDVQIEQGDMRDLSRFPDASFDLVYQPYSINFVPDPLLVLSEVGRVLRENGRYYLQFANPLFNMEETDWTEKGYPIRQPYIQGQSSTPEDFLWHVEQPDGSIKKMEGPQEFTHTLSTLVNGLGNNGLHIFAMYEGPVGDPSAEPGTWEHMKTYLPFWPAFWARKNTSL